MVEYKFKKFLHFFAQLNVKIGIVPEVIKMEKVEKK